MRAGLALLLLAVVTVAAGCGGGGGGGEKVSASQGGATLVPADVAAFVRVTTDESSDQWKKADKLLSKFPGREQLLSQVRKGLSSQGLDFERDVLPALGPEVDIVVFDFENTDQTVVGLTKPDDPDKLVEVLKSGKDAPKVIKKRDDGWVVFGDSQAMVDRIGAGGEKLSDADGYKAALEKLPGEALATAWFDGNAILSAGAKQSGGTLTASAKVDWVAAALDARDDGAEVKVATKSPTFKGAGAYKSAVLDKVPSGTLLFASFKGADTALQKLGDSAGAAGSAVESTLGMPIGELAALFSGETALYGRPGTPIPELTVVLDGKNATAKLATLAKLAQKASSLAGGEPPRTTTIDGAQMTELRFGPVAVFYGESDGRILITDSRNAVRDLRGGGQSLADDDVFKSAKQAAGMPDDTSGFLYVNLKDLIPEVAGLAGSALTPDVQANLRPLRTLLAYATADGDTTVGTLFLEIK